MEHKELQAVISDGEKILWQGRPNKLVYMARTFASLILPIGIMAPVFVWWGGGVLISIPAMRYIVAAVFTLSLFAPLYRFLVYKYLVYIITDKRIILQRGLIGRDFDFVDYDKVESAGVSVGIFDKVMGQNTGTVSVYANRLQAVSNSYKDVSGRTHRSTGTVNVPFTLDFIVDPYGVFNMFKKTSFDIKADINFPNALRPEKNDGYDTSYNSPDKR